MGAASAPLSLYTIKRNAESALVVKAQSWPDILDTTRVRFPPFKARCCQEREPLRSPTGNVLKKGPALLDDHALQCTLACRLGGDPRGFCSTTQPRWQVLHACMHGLALLALLPGREARTSRAGRQWEGSMWHAAQLQQQQHLAPSHGHPLSLQLCALE